MYLSNDELEIIQQGKLREYLGQFDLENNEDYLQQGSIDLHMLSGNKAKSSPFMDSDMKTV